ncbi:MAG: methytransferase partner Trm112 [Dehalococcoidia bacterium]
MRRDLMDILVCPLCHGELDLRVEQEAADRVIEGNLRCRACGADFPINDGLPNLLPPELREA